MDLNRFQRAAKLQDAGQIAEALKEYQSLANAITDVGEKASVMLNEVNCLSQLGENEQARKRLSEVYNLLPEHSEMRVHADRKSTRLNSSHLVISYAVFCLKKKK